MPTPPSGTAKARLLLHTCCAPCALECVRALAGEGRHPDLFWFNPNIHPYTEFRARLTSLELFAAEESLSLWAEDPYGLRQFMACLYGGEIGLEQAFRHHPLLEGHGSPKSFSDAAFEKELRCPRCYLFRLEKTAARAQAEGYGAFSTTLLISPYQQHDLIRRLGEELGAHYRVEFLYRDFRPRFRSGQEAARQRGCYIQKYCGCVFSEEERYRKTPQKAGLPREAADSE